MKFTDEHKTGRKDPFKTIAEQIATLGISNVRNYSLGFTFSQAVQQTGQASGKLRKWVKGWSIPDAIGTDVGGVLQKALELEGLGNVKVKALLNDVVATHLAVPNADLGLILGTGFTYSLLDQNGQILNTDAGGFMFGDLPQTIFDRTLFQNIDPIHDHAFEKMLSGAYLGKLLRMHLKFLRDRGVFMKEREVVPFIDTPQRLSAEEFDNEDELKYLIAAVQLDVRQRLKYPIPEGLSPREAAGWINKSPVLFKLFDSYALEKYLTDTGRELYERVRRQYDVNSLSDLSGGQVVRLVESSDGQRLQRIILDLIYADLVPGSPDVYMMKLISYVEQFDGVSALKQALSGGDRFRLTEMSDNDLKILWEQCHTLSLRAGRLVAAVLFAGIKTMDTQLDKDHLVAVDGSVWENHPKMRGYVEDAIKELRSMESIDGKGKIAFQFIKDASGVGAAIAAAIASSSDRAMSSSPLDELNNFYAKQNQVAKEGDYTAVMGLVDLMDDDNSDNNDPPYIRRDTSTIALIEIGRRDSEHCVPLLMGALQNEKYRRIQSDLIYILGKIGDSRATKLLLQLFDKGNHRYRITQALGHIRDRMAVDRLIKELSENPDSGIAEALGRIGDDRAVQPLIDVITNNNFDRTSRLVQSAGRALAHIGDERAIEPLIKVLYDSTTKNNYLGSYNNDTWSSLLMILSKKKIVLEQVLKFADPVREIVNTIWKMSNKNDAVLRTYFCYLALPVTGLTLGSRQFLKMYLYYLFVNDSSLREADVVRAVQQDILPGLRVLETLGKDSHMGGEIAEESGDWNELRSKEYLSNFFMSWGLFFPENESHGVRWSDLVGGSRYGKFKNNHLELRMLPGNYPITYLNFLLHLRSGLLGPQSDISTTIQGELNQEAFMVLYLGLFSFGPLTPLEPQTLGDAINFGNAYQSYIGQTIDPKTGLILWDKTQTYFADKTFGWIKPAFENLRRSGQVLVNKDGQIMAEKNIIAEILRMDLEMKELLSYYAYAYFNDKNSVGGQAYQEFKAEVGKFLIGLKENDQAVFTPDEISTILGQKDRDFYFSGNKYGDKTPLKLNEINVRALLFKLRHHFEISREDLQVFRQVTQHALSKLKDLYYQDQPLYRRIMDAIKLGPEGLKNAVPNEEELIAILYRHDEKQKKEAVKMLEVIGTTTGLQALLALMKSPHQSEEFSILANNIIVTIQKRLNISTDNSMIGSSTDGKVSNGGIDLTRDKMGLQVQSLSSGVQFNFDPAMMQQLQNATGLTPVIIDIRPMMTSVPVFLGLKGEEKIEQLSMR
ncbi:MAG: hypothetical protein WCI27_09725 [Candidatus Omnitrophota bacterium]